MNKLISLIDRIDWLAVLVIAMIAATVACFAAGIAHGAATSAAYPTATRGYVYYAPTRYLSTATAEIGYPYPPPVIDAYPAPEVYSAYPAPVTLQWRPPTGISPTPALPEPVMATPEPTPTPRGYVAPYRGRE